MLLSSKTPSDTKNELAAFQHVRSNNVRLATWAMQSFYPPLKRVSEAATEPSVPRRGHSALVAQAARAGAASGSASYCTPELWLGRKEVPREAKAKAVRGRLIGDSLEVTYQERLTSFGPEASNDLVELIESRHRQFGALSLCTALHRLAAVPSRDAMRCKGLASSLEAELRVQPDRFRSQSIANACWAVAKLQWQVPGLWEALLQTAVKRMESFKAQELSLLLWSMANSRCMSSASEHILEEFLRRGAEAFDAQSTATLAYAAGALHLKLEAFWSAIGTHSATRVAEFSDRQLANLVWGFATASYSDCEVVFERVAKEAPIATLAPIDLSLVAWALAKVFQGEPDFYDRVAEAIVCKKSEWHHSDTRNIATLLYSLALAEQAVSHEAAFRHLAAAVCRRTREFSVQGLTNAVWAYATALYVESNWFSSVSEELLRRGSEDFEALDVANCLWAFAAVLQQDMAVKRLISLGTGMLSEFSVQNLAITAWSLAALELRHEFFHRAADPFVQRLVECKTQELNNMLWAYATVSVRLPWLFLKAAKHAMSLGLQDFKTHELSIMLWAHGTAGVCNHTFFDAVVDEMLFVRGTESWLPREIANSAWAYSSIIGRCHWPFMTAISLYASQRVQEFDMQGLGNVLWSFANVAAYSKQLLRSAALETARRCGRHEAAHNVAQVLSAVQVARGEGLEAWELELCEAATGLFLAKGFGDIGAREFLILGNAALPMAKQLNGWQQLESLLEERIFRPLAEAISSGETGWARVETCVSELDVDHLGAGFTGIFLKRLGLSSVHACGGPAWIREGARACALERERAIQAGVDEDAAAEQQKLVRQLDKVNKREIVAWVRYQVTFPQSKQQAGRAFSWRLESQMVTTRFDQHLRPVITKSRIAPNMVGQHDRSGHAERCALLDVTHELLGNQDIASEIKGDLQLYITHYPCISCVCIIAQFIRLFPGLSMELAYADGRTSNTQRLEEKGMPFDIERFPLPASPTRFTFNSKRFRTAQTVYYRYYQLKGIRRNERTDCPHTIRKSSTRNQTCTK